MQDKLLELLEVAYLKQAEVFNSLQNTDALSTSDIENQEVADNNMCQAIITLVNNHATPKDSKVYESVINDYLNDIVDVSWFDFSEFLNTLVLREVLSMDKVLDLMCDYGMLYNIFVTNILYSLSEIQQKVVTDMLSSLHKLSIAEARKYLIKQISENMAVRSILKGMEEFVSRELVY